MNFDGLNEGLDEALTERKKALMAIYAIRKPPKISILNRDPDDEELLAIRVIQKFYRGYHIRKHMKKLKLARCREIVVRNRFGMKTFPYGFVLKNQYEQRIIEVIGTKDGEREHMRSEMQAKIDELL